ncbi:MAG: NAD-dependent epimerase/dehydratase family protein [Bacteroidales bacterium]|nr:NAD-dependent epimerase/dehydratase family protein [Bacteroidales bacterium]
MQTILGSGGAIGTDLAKELKNYSDKIRLVSRHPKKVNESDELFAADITNPDQILKAIEGSEIVYITVGFEYKAKVWEQIWPNFIKNVIEGCEKYHSKLVFFDNVYMYDPSHIPHMTEETPMNPCSRKGETRKKLVEMITLAEREGRIKAVIARAADFYGPGINNSVLLETVYKTLKAGKKANWFCTLDKVHSYTYTPDAARATAMLGNDEKAYGQTWHLPTSPNPLTGKQWIDAFAKELNVKPKTQVAGKFLIQLMGLFNSIMKEFVEMLYQYDRDYVFDSSKFEKAYNFKATPYAEGVKNIVSQG